MQTSVQHSELNSPILIDYEHRATRRMSQQQLGKQKYPAIKSKLTRVNKEIQWVCLVNWTGKQLRKTGNFHIEIISVFIYSLREGDLVRLLASFGKTR